jgi:hypothetical protein
MAGERGDVLTALAERRQQHREHGDAVPEVLAEPSLAHHRGQIAMRCRHDPRVHLD